MSVMPGMASRSQAFIAGGVSGELTSSSAAMRVSWMCSLLLHAEAGSDVARQTRSVNIIFRILNCFLRNGKRHHHGGTEANSTSDATPLNHFFSNLCFVPILQALLDFQAHLRVL